MTKRKLIGENDDDNNPPKRLKLSPDPIQKVFSISRLVASVIAPFLPVHDKIQLCNTARQLHSYLHRSGVAFATGFWKINNPYELPLPGDRGFDSLMARLPVTIQSHLYLNFPTPKPEQTLQRVYRALGHMQDKCDRICRIRLNCCDTSDPNPLLIDWQALPRFRCEHVCVHSGVKITNIVSVHQELWSTYMNWSELSWNHQFLHDSRVQSVDLEIGRHCLDQPFDEISSDSPVCGSVRILELYLGAVIKGETTNHRIGFWYLQRLFPSLTDVYLSGTTSRPVKWIEDDVFQWLSRGIQVHIGKTLVATNVEC